MPRFVRLLLLAILLSNNLIPSAADAAPLAQTPTPPAANPQAARILAGLSPEERVGQLFLVTFVGTATDEASPIHELITRYHIGGVALQAANDNFTETDSFIANLRSLTSALQMIAAAGAAAPQTSTPTPTAVNESFVPLFIAMQLDDESYPGSSFMPGFSGLTALPNLMTLGAAWNPSHASVAGQIAGQELSALGVNLLLGPTLDVLEVPQPASAADLGARAFGGDPYWVGLLGQSFIQGVHEGSGGRVAVVSRHFPGYGASDRTLEEQVPTVSKSLAELTAIDLAPFFAVTKAGSPGSTDALLVSHIRYRGFQGNIRDTTRPISFDQQALGVLLSLPQIAGWRAAGGLTVSDVLGVRAVRRFYDVTGRTFPAFNIARDAFLAGNDVLYLGQFAQSNQSDQFDTIRTVLTQFVQKYKEDPAFALRVDDAVTRIIALKLELYGQFTLDAVRPATNPELLGTNRAAAFAAIRDGATLISPSPVEVADRLPSPPSINERIVFFTDARLTRQCSQCAPRAILAPDAFQQAVVKLYGPPGTGEVANANLTSFTFADLANFLDGKPRPPTATPEPTPENNAATATPAPAPPSVGEAISSAQWVVFAMLDVKAGIAASNALNRLLAERPDLLRGRRVIVFAFDAPYYLDTTEVAQLTAYYALYSKTSAAVDVAARILFQEITPSGASPVSVPAVGYNLIEATQPDPKQVIQLFSDAPRAENATALPPDVTPTPPAFAVNNVVALRTGVILDRNGHQVPDGTVVKFYVTYVNEGLTALLAESTTMDGVAHASLRLDRIGLVEVRATSEPALSSFTLQFNAQEAPSTPIVITPTPGPTDTPRPTETLQTTFAPEATPVPASSQPDASRRVRPGDLLTALFAIAALGALGWRLTRSRGEAVSNGVKLLLTVAIGVGAGYDYFALGLPGSALLYGLRGWGATAAVWIGGVVGFAVGWWWLKGKAGSRTMNDER